MSTRQLIRFLLPFLRPYQGRFYLATFLRLSGDVSFLYLPYALGKIITILSDAAHGGSAKGVWFYFVAWLLIFTYRSIMVNVAKYIGMGAGEQAALDAGLAATKHLFQLDISWHERENTGNKVKRIRSGSEGINRLVKFWYQNFIEIVVNFVGMIIIIASFDLVIGLSVVGFIIIHLGGAWYMKRNITDATKFVNIEEEKSEGLVFEAINNIRTAKVLSLTDALYEQLVSQSKEVYQRLMRFLKTLRGYGLMTDLSPNVFRMLMYGFIIYGILHGRFEVGFFAMFWAYFNNIWKATSSLTDGMQDVAIAQQRIARLQEILNEPINIDDETNKIDFPEMWKTIKFLDVSFAYGDNQVLKHISFEIKRGERVGVVGLSGAGKSTLIKLLLKEHESYTGDILFDDVSIREIKKSLYLKQVAVVLQDTEVFNFSLKENITIARAGASDEDGELQHALQVAHVADFLSRLPQGVYTLIGEKGIRLSGGERQRLGIARAIYKQPEILFLDEATSHLDLESEEKIRDSLHQFFQSVTAIVIAHRLTTIREMDRILVIEDGRIIETGTFDALQKKRGRFFELWEKQKL